MNKWFKWIATLAGGALIIAIAASVVAFKPTGNVSASAGLAANTSTLQHRGGPGMNGLGGEDGQYLADALGIPLADLQTAQQTANDAAVQQALDLGLITQEQADNMILAGRGFLMGQGFGIHDSTGAAVDTDALLAEALGISVEELNTARQQAQSAKLAQMVADGTLTQEEADLIVARQALQSYLDPNALLAQAYGISVDELQAYRDEGLTTTEILAKVGKTAAEVRDARQAAYEAAIGQAVADGVITQAQADTILANNGMMDGGWMFGNGMGGGPEGRHGRGGMGGPEGTPPDPNTAPTN